MARSALQDVSDLVREYMRQHKWGTGIGIAQENPMVEEAHCAIMGISPSQFTRSKSLLRFVANRHSDTFRRTFCGAMPPFNVECNLFEDSGHDCEGLAEPPPVQIIVVVIHAHGEGMVRFCNRARMGG